MDKSPLVTIIVPVYNVEKYVSNCLKSLLSQTYSNLEIIVVDDGSTDQSVEICKKISNNDKRVTLYQKKNGGLSDARNYGIDRSNGEYLLFIDSDDYVSPILVENVIKVALNTNSDIVQFGYEKVNKEKEIDNINKGVNEYRILDHEEALINCLSYNAIDIMVWNKIYKKRLFERLRFKYGIYHEDEQITPLLVDESNKVAIINDIYYYYVQREGSIMHSTSSGKDLIYLNIFKERFTFFNKKYNYKYDLIMSYHAYVTLRFLSIHLKSKNSLLNKKIRFLEKKLLLNKKCTLNIKARVLIYATMPRLVMYLASK